MDHLSGSETANSWSPIGVTENWVLANWVVKQLFLVSWSGMQKSGFVFNKKTFVFDLRNIIK